MVDVGLEEVDGDDGVDLGLNTIAALGGDARGLGLFLGGIAVVANGLHAVGEFEAEDFDGFEPVGLAAFAAFTLDHGGVWELDGGGVHFFLLFRCGRVGFPDRSLCDRRRGA